MHLEFLGAAQTVTGSMHLLRTRVRIFGVERERRAEVASRLEAGASAQGQNQPFVPSPGDRLDIGHA